MKLAKSQFRGSQVGSETALLFPKDTIIIIIFHSIQLYIITDIHLPLTFRSDSANWPTC